MHITHWSFQLLFKKTRSTTAPSDGAGVFIYLFFRCLSFIWFDISFKCHISFPFFICGNTESTLWKEPKLLLTEVDAISSDPICLFCYVYVYSVQYCHKCVYKHMSCLVYVVIIITFAINISMILSWVWLLTVELASSICGCQKMIFAICIKNEIVELSSVYGHHNHLCNNYSAWN